MNLTMCLYSTHPTLQMLRNWHLVCPQSQTEYTPVVNTDQIHMQSLKVDRYHGALAMLTAVATITASTAAV